MSYFVWTGNPWVDAGVSAMLEWTKKKEPKDLTLNDAEEMAEELVHLYLTDGWKKSLFSVFPNNPVTNSSVKNKESKLKEFFRELLNGFEPISSAGNCIACGSRNCNQQRTRRDIPLTGYGGSHYFPYKTDGADYCDVCSFAVQCAPLVFYRCEKYLALIHSNSLKVLRYWAKKCVGQVRRQIAMREYTGCFNEEFKNPMNALFHIIQDLIFQYDEQWTEENASVRIYLFTNYNQRAELAFYDLPAPVFRFLASVRRHSKFPDWLKVVRKGYKYNITGKEESEYKNDPNEVYQRLLNGESIIRYFLDFGNKQALGDWALLSLYLKEVRNMDQKRIDTIRRVADEISELIKSSANVKKRLNQLEMADNYNWFRNVLLRFVKDQIAQRKEEPLFTFEEYVDQLFPDGALGWKETQDLILFRIYEKLHSWLIQQGVAEELREEEQEMEADS
jgi:CRISPR-associated protein Cst1